MRRLLREIDSERPVLLAGPTASGKSVLAMEIAAARGGVIVNADALQVYACWRVLTARPTVADEAAVGHRLYGHVAGDARYSVGAWLRDVEPLLSGPRPIIVGGTGLYFTRLTSGLVEIPAIPAQVRQAAAVLAPDRLLAELDPGTADRVDRRNPARLRRAWEVQRATGRPLHAWQDETPPALLPLGDTQAFVMEIDRDDLNRRIAVRADRILADGAIEETSAVVGTYGPDAPAMKAIGARQIAEHVAGRISLGTARERLVVATRQYAKRQRTWFRSNMGAWARIATS